MSNRIAHVYRKIAFIIALVLVITTVLAIDGIGAVRAKGNLTLTKPIVVSSDGVKIGGYGTAIQISTPEDLATYGISFTPADDNKPAELTLHNTKIEIEQKIDNQINRIYTPIRFHDIDTCKVSLWGDNSISMTPAPQLDQNSAQNIYGIYSSSSDLIFDGTGSLDIDLSSIDYTSYPYLKINCINAKKLVVKEDVTITAKSGNVSNEQGSISAGIYVHYTYNYGTIENHGKIEVDNSSAAGYDVEGIYTENLINTGTITSTGGYGTNWSEGLIIYLKKSSTSEIQSGTVTLDTVSNKNKLFNSSQAANSSGSKLVVNGNLILKGNQDGVESAYNIELQENGRITITEEGTSFTLGKAISTPISKNVSVKGGTHSGNVYTRTDRTKEDMVIFLEHEHKWQVSLVTGSPDKIQAHCVADGLCAEPVYTFTLQPADSNKYSSTYDGVTTSWDSEFNVLGAPTIEYYTNDNTKTSTNDGAITDGGAPSKQGTYIVKATVKGNDEGSSSATAQATFNIHGPNEKVWEYDEEEHWHPCIIEECREQSHRYDKSNHSWKFSKNISKPTCSSEGEDEYICEECDKTKSELIAKAPTKHDFSDNTEYCKYGCNTKNPDYVAPSPSPSTDPSTDPSSNPSDDPSTSPSPSKSPSTSPSKTPSATPSTSPSTSPSKTPSATPSTSPSTSPSKSPSTTPSTSPSSSASTSPTPSATGNVVVPSTSASKSPSPSKTPILNASKSPSPSAKAGSSTSGKTGSSAATSKGDSSTSDNVPDTFRHLTMREYANIPDSILNTPLESLFYTALTKSEQADAWAGEEINVWIDIEKVTSPDTDTTNTIETVANQYTVNAYYDINMLKQIGDTSATKIAELPGGSISISIPIPKELKEESQDKNLVYRIIRLHKGGEPDIIIPTVERGFLTFETDRFSTYALASANKGDLLDFTTAGTTGASRGLWLILIFVIFDIVAVAILFTVGYIKNRPTQKR